jgi:hypothetical protein
MRLCEIHRINDAMRNDEPCVYCQRDNLKLQIDIWKRYYALLSEELESAIGMAWIYGWRSTPEKIEAGRKLRMELGLPDNGLDAYAGAPFCVCRPFTYQEGLDHNCIKCGLPMEKRKCVAECMDRHFCNAPKLHEGGCHCKLDG